MSNCILSFTIKHLEEKKKKYQEMNIRDSAMNKVPLGSIMPQSLVNTVLYLNPAKGSEDTLFNRISLILTEK